MTKGQRPYNGAKIVYSKLMLEQLDIPMESINLDTDLKLIYLNIKRKIVKLLEDKIGGKPRWFWVWQWLIRYSIKGMVQERNNQLPSIVIKIDSFLKMINFCCVKDNFKAMRRQATNWEKVFAKDKYDKCLPKTYKEAFKLNNNKRTWLKNGAKT